jgi:hypothetical protein
MKRIIIISLILLPCVIFVTRAQRTSRLHRFDPPTAPLAPRPEAEPQEPRHELNLRFAWKTPITQLQTASLIHSEAENDAEDEDEGDCDEHAKLTDFEAQSTSTRPATATRVAVASDWMSSEERARLNLREKQLEQLSLWLADSGVDPSWTPPRSLADRLLPKDFEVVEQDRDYGLMYRANSQLALSSTDRQRLGQEYDRQIAEKRLGLMGGVLVFVLACLGVSTAYVRTDEATQGYYTNRLRLVAAASVGAAGVLLFDWLRHG